MQRIRVTQIIQGLDIGSHSGGAEAFAVRLAQSLDPTLFDVRIFCLNVYHTPFENMHISRLHNANIPVHLPIHPPGQNLSSLLSAFASLWHHIDKYRPHILHSHSERGDLLNASMAILHPYGLKAMRTVHIDEQWQTHPLFGAVFNQILAPLIFAAETCVSETVRAWLDSRLVARSLNRLAHLSYNGIDENLLLSPPPRTQLDPDNSYIDGTLRIGIVGRLSIQKGHRYLLKALAWVRQMIPVNLYIIGAGELEDQLKSETTQLHITESVHFLGQCNDAQTLISSLDLLVSASLWEGFPTVILEAMAHGVPVIATDVSGSRELVKTGVTGILVDPASSSQLATAIMAMYTNPEAVAVMSAHAKAQVAQFTIQKTVGRIAQIYQCVAN